MPFKFQCAGGLQLICEQHVTEVLPNITAALKLYLTMPIMRCEAEMNFSKLFFISSHKMKLYVTMLLEKLEKESFVKCAPCSTYFHRHLK